MSATNTTTSGQPPPQFIRPNFDRMPSELKLLKNWVLWAAVWNGSKWTKRPLQVSGYGASTTKPKHWSSFDDVEQAYELAIARGYMEVHEKGKSLVARETREKAEFFVHQLQGFGLQATMERSE